MRSNLTLALAAVACGLAGATAALGATVDPAAQATKSTAAQSSLIPAQGKFGGGFSAIRSHKGSALKDSPFIQLPDTGYAVPQALTRPDDGHAWRSGLTALARVVPNVAAGSSATGLQAPQGMKAPAAGLSALRHQSGPRGNALAAVPAQSSAGLAGLQRPEGSAWSDQGRNSLRSDVVAPVPNTK
jgi:hypothetical protein